MRGREYDPRSLSSINLFEEMGIFMRDRLPTHYLRQDRAVFCNSMLFRFLQEFLTEILYKLTVEAQTRVNRC